MAARRTPQQAVDALLRRCNQPSRAVCARHLVLTPRRSTPPPADHRSLLLCNSIACVGQQIFTRDTPQNREQKLRHQAAAFHRLRCRVSRSRAGLSARHSAMEVVIGPLARLQVERRDLEYARHTAPRVPATFRAVSHTAHIRAQERSVKRRDFIALASSARNRSASRDHRAPTI